MCQGSACFLHLAALAPLVWLLCAITVAARPRWRRPVWTPPAEPLRLRPGAVSTRANPSLMNPTLRFNWADVTVDTELTAIYTMPRLARPPSMSSRRGIERTPR